MVYGPNGATPMPSAARRRSGGGAPQLAGGGAGGGGDAAVSFSLLWRDEGAPVRHIIDYRLRADLRRPAWVEEADSEA